MKRRSFLILLLAAGLASGPVFSQEFGFGFGTDDSSGSSGSSGGVPDGSSAGGFGLPGSSFGASVGGKIKAGLTVFPGDFDSAAGFAGMTAGDIFSGNLSVSASSARAEGYVNFKVVPDFSGTVSPISIDEAYARFFLGPAAVTGGIRKLTWGKADSRGVLDVTNPYDYTDLSEMYDLPAMKIGRPMFHVSFRLGTFSSLEGLFIPWFEGHRFPTAGRWTPAQFAEMGAFLQGMGVDPLNVAVSLPNTKSLKYAQGGLRFTATLGGSDLGVQYFYGNLMEPSVRITGLGAMPPEPAVAVDYPRYHQLGVDFARIIGGFNLRAEAAINLTEDIAGDDPEIPNPFVGWNVGFDRNLFAGVNLNLQGNGTVRLMDGKVKAGDIQDGTSMSQSFVTAVVSRKFLRDELEVQVSANWGIEDEDVMLLPGVIWTRDDIEVRLLGGIFAGNKKGNQGQYYKNGFIKLMMSYTF